jgi:6-phosphogluconolactonase
MKRRIRLSKLSLLVLACCTTTALAAPALVGAQYGYDDGTVYTLTNATSGNQVLVFDRKANGSLSPRQSFHTGGTGTGGGLGNQGALALSDSGQWLLAVNPGSDSVSVFFVFGDYLLRTDTAHSGGDQPVSVTIEDDTVYVLNAGSDDLQGFRLSIYGRLTPIEHSRRPLSGTGTGAAQVEFSRAGDLLAVTEKATNNVLTFAVDGDGRLGPANVQASPAPTPFGFAFGRRDVLVVSEAAGGAAGASTVSSYQLQADGQAHLVTAASPSGQSAACWVVATRDGRYAYVANAGSGNLSTYGVAADGALELLDADAAGTGPGSGPTDMALDRNSRYLYALSPATGTISAFSVAADGTLELIEHQGSGGITAAATGLVAR